MGSCVKLKLINDMQEYKTLLGVRCFGRRCIKTQLFCCKFPQCKKCQVLVYSILSMSKQAWFFPDRQFTFKQSSPSPDTDRQLGRPTPVIITMTTRSAVFRALRQRYGAVATTVLITQYRLTKRHGIKQLIRKTQKQLYASLLTRMRTGQILLVFL